MGLAKAVLQGIVNGARRRGRQKKKWEGNLRKWTGLNYAASQRIVEDRVKWREIVTMSFKMSPDRLGYGTNEGSKKIEIVELV